MSFTMTLPFFSHLIIRNIEPIDYSISFGTFSEAPACGRDHMPSCSKNSDLPENVPVRNQSISSKMDELVLLPAVQLTAAILDSQRNYQVSYWLPALLVGQL